MSSSPVQIGRPPRVIVVGGGAAGFFGAIAAAECGADVTILEKTARVLDKVRISGGGRCNVTHACFEPREFATRYPRGERALLSPFSKFSARDTVAWFESHGVKLKTESDGRMFPTTDSSQTIINCLMDAAQKAGVQIRLNCGVESVTKTPDGRFEIHLASPHEPKLEERTPHPGPLPIGSADFADAEREKRSQRLGDGTRQILDGGGQKKSAEIIFCDKFLLATGGCRAAAAGKLASSLGHTIVAPVPSLFTFQIETPWLRELAGVAVDAEVSIPQIKLRERGAVLVTHWGLSGPAVLKLSAWGARELAALDYKFPLLVNWLPEMNVDSIIAEFQKRRERDGAKLLVNAPLAPLTARLWEQLVLAAGIAREARWSALPKPQALALAQKLVRMEFPVVGKSLNKDEFVTCGGVKLPEVNFKTMESKVCSGLFFAGELLDIDGITGGFNFQNAWTTGFIAGNSMAG